MDPVSLFTVGHGTLGQEEFITLLSSHRIANLVDVRSYPGSHRHPHFGRESMAEWVAEAGVAYSWERALGGFRRAAPDSANFALRHDNFRGYADHMTDPDFAEGLDCLVGLAGAARTAVMCSESLWWRCHRRLLADALVLWRGCQVTHVRHDGRLDAHRLTEGVRAGPGGRPVYDVGVSGRLGL